ncbi:MAG TPA: ATP-dependent DNA ligase [Acidimicrobiales bacterium]|nr:ATP-dependent DNA ligase [Acidimicrobiales bacterium]
MRLPVNPPVKPMLAKLTRDFPEADDLIYEPKWDGFRCIVFRDGDEIELGSRNEKPLTRYFPELVESLRANIPERVVLDGEIVIPGENGLDFDALQLRMHPAESRVKKLSAEIPASFVAFDLLALDDEDLTKQPFSARRGALEKALKKSKPPIHLTPATTDPDTARDWFERFEGAGLDGVIAKPSSITYQPDKRIMLKIKHQRTVDCAVGGFRVHKDGEGVGSLMLGLFDDAGNMHHVGVATSFSAAKRKGLLDELAPYRTEGDDLGDHPWAEWARAEAHQEGKRLPGAGNRWNAGKDMSWTPLKLGLVAEVAYDGMQGDRFRHATQLVRWRPDRDPRSCSYDQLDRPVPELLQEVFDA